jgi:hypothetical protein
LTDSYNCPHRYTVWQYRQLYEYRHFYEAIGRAFSDAYRIFLDHRQLGCRSGHPTDEYGNEEANKWDYREIPSASFITVEVQYEEGVETCFEGEHVEEGHRIGPNDIVKSHNPAYVICEGAMKDAQ